MAKDEKQALGVESETKEPKKFLGIELTFNPKPKPRKYKSLIELNPVPVANFLPVRFSEAKNVEYVRRRLFAVSIVTLSLCFLAFVASSAVSFSGDLLLANAQLRLSQVKAEQAKYSDIASLERDILFQDAARVAATGTEINYRALIRSMNQELPYGARFISIQAEPYSVSDQESEGLAKPYATKLSVTMELVDFPSLQTFLNRIPRLGAFYDAKLSSVATIDSGISVSLVAYFGVDLYTRPFSEAIVVGDEVPGTVLDTPVPFPTPTPTPSGDGN